MPEPAIVPPFDSRRDGRHREDVAPSAPTSAYDRARPTTGEYVPEPIPDDAYYVVEPWRGVIRAIRANDSQRLRLILVAAAYVVGGLTTWLVFH